MRIAKSSEAAPGEDLAIAALAGSWTETPQHDPGITLLELFAYVVEVLSHYQDETAAESYLRTVKSRDGSTVRISVREISSLALPCSTRDEFERRLSSLADIIKLLDIPDELLPAADKLPAKSQTLVRLELLFTSRLADEDRVEVVKAIATLRSINRLRVGGQHSGAQGDRARAADTLAVSLDGRWGEAWDRVRAVASHALRDIGNGARRIADSPFLDQDHT